MSDDLPRAQLPPMFAIQMSGQPSLVEKPLKLAAIEHLRARQNSGEGFPNWVEYTLCCDFCLEPFPARNKNSGKQRTSVEYELLRFALMITNPNYDPVVCDKCYPQVIVLGEQRSGHLNLVLMHSSKEAE